MKKVVDLSPKLTQRPAWQELKSGDHNSFVDTLKLRTSIDALTNRLSQTNKGEAITVEKQKSFPLPSGWELIENNNIPEIVKDGLSVFQFPNNWSKKYTYFKCLWSNYGVRITYKELYKFETEKNYPKKGGWKINKKMRDEINKLKKKIKIKKIPINIETNKGFTLTIS